VGKTNEKEKTRIHPLKSRGGGRINIGGKGETKHCGGQVAEVVGGREEHESKERPRKIGRPKS